MLLLGGVARSPLADKARSLLSNDGLYSELTLVAQDRCPAKLYMFRPFSYTQHHEGADLSPPGVHRSEAAAHLDRDVER